MIRGQPSCKMFSTAASKVKSIMFGGGTSEKGREEKKAAERKWRRVARASQVNKEEKGVCPRSKRLIEERVFAPNDAMEIENVVVLKKKCIKVAQASHDTASQSDSVAGPTNWALSEQ